MDKPRGRGIAAMIAAVALFSAMDALMKLLPPDRDMRSRVSGGTTQREKREASLAVRASSHRRRRTRSCRLSGITPG